MSMISNYFSKLKDYKKTYGNKTILLWQCGSFYEIYGLRNKKTNEYFESHIKQYSDILGMTIAPKKITLKGEHKDKQLVMAGYGTSVPLEKYVPKLNKEGYTVVVWEEIGDDPVSRGKTRKEKGIFSIGTNFDIQTRQLTNTVMCIWIETFQKSIINKTPTICMGFSCIDIFTGNVNLFQYTQSTNNIHEPCIFDEFERFVSIYKPKEVILIHNYNKEKMIDDIIYFTGLQNTKIHIINLNNKDTRNTKNALKCEKQVWHQEILMNNYDITDFNIFYESNRLKEFSWTAQSFVYLIYFVGKHNPNLVLHLEEPVYDNIENSLLLATHSLKQLNVIDNGQLKTKSKMSNLESFLNRCVTTMGERRFSYNILHPKTDVKELKKEYEITTYILENYDFFINIRNQLKIIKDIEKYERKLVLRKIVPSEIYEMFNNITCLLDIKETLGDYHTTNQYIDKIDNNIVGKCKHINTFLNRFIQFGKAKYITKNDYSENLFKKNVFPHLDKIHMEYVENDQKIKAIQRFLCSLVEKKEKKKIKSQFVKVKNTAKTGLWLEATSRRCAIIKSELNKIFNLTNTTTLKYDSQYDNETKEFTVSFYNFKTIKTSQSNCKIMCVTLNKLYETHFQSIHILSDVIEQCYNDFLNKFIIFIKDINIIVKYAGILDLIITKAYIARKFRYCCPIIKDNVDKSFFHAKQLRHPLIEHINQDELYVPNDISLGYKNTDGVLLYGTNAVGKSSLIKSIGMAVIMAQAGLFVPCDSFIYNPYKILSTRILGNDNIFKGLSSFGVEISELKTIHKIADKYSLVLGDELCSGTENKSAIIIFTGSLKMLSTRAASYIFATHFHKLATVQTIKNIKTLKMKHLSVLYNSADDKLIYDRILKDGTGRNMYGLEVCKSMGMDDEFMDNLQKIRAEIYPEDIQILEQKNSRYNVLKIKNMCEICKNRIGEEIHHLNPQENADILGNIGYFNKNHTANLINICKDCHIHITKNKIIHRRTKTSIGYEYVKHSNGYEIVET